MHNFNVGIATSPAQTHAQLLSLEKNLSADMYHYPVPLRDMDDAGRAVAATYVAGGLTGGGASLPPFWELTEAANNLGIQFYVPRNPRWLHGQLYLTVEYTVDIGGGNIVWDLAGNAISDGTTLPTRTFTTRTVAAPAAADEWDVLEMTTSNTAAFHIPITSEHSGIIFVLGRRPASASDTSTGNVRVHKVIAHYQETKREIGDKF